MSEELHDTHEWGERSFTDDEGTRLIPFCTTCKVDGFINEPSAFTECPGPPQKRQPAREVCLVTRDSWDNPGHTHSCLGGIHPRGMHFCADCREWFGVKA